ncbi:PhoH family protein [Comamonas aquatica]|uniref:PhoH family protein n=1 Tax=Comamonas aquatica TaxID=225991 RepID=A0AA42W1K7_9BURK|nr:PhoH family protein [Comamonas aquatica]MDH0361514.1 PhoH family protein [Comamonas aquatica]MDH0380263.1 PhoH family protein [Comamonas aquatica]MDH0428283.1 PhoH family protein [Comamonas aquatica]MDH0940167.1 PhoH family protein [Comamonas aquatica]MDH1378052.1 PhoH family protein [Comamonas aquatica]
MPLPPAPTKRAARVAKEAFDVTARTSKRATAATPDTEDTQPTPLTSTPAPALTPPPARSGKKAASTATASAATTAAAQSLAQQRAAVQQKTAAAAPALKATPAPAPATPAASSRKRSTAPAATAPAPAASNPARPTKKRMGQSCLFVLDTNVLLHDPTSIFRFEEHDIFLPMVVLEELDAHKKGMTEVARNGRQVSRMLDALVDAQQNADLAIGLRLDASGNKGSTGHLFFQTVPLDYRLPASLPQGKADNQILGVVQALRAAKQGQQEVILVSKDINMRVKARALGLPAEDYRNDKALDDGDLLYTGSLALPADFWRKAKNVESWQQGGRSFYSLSGPVTAPMLINQYVYFEAPGEPSLHARVTEIRDKTVVLETLRDYSSSKHNVWGVNARNREQNFALNLLMDPEVDFVTLTGTAGTGKTLMALAAGLCQVLDERRYTEIIMTRATVSVGEDIGFLPGTEEEKMGPWMGALDDNLEFLAKGDGGNPNEWGRAATNELIRSRIKIKSMNFMRGRTFLNKYVIIDEAQNLTPKQMKTLITRAGPGTKIICMGNLGQIDTPYLTEGSSGLTFAVDRFKGWPHSGHIQLARGERSRLADFASEVL